MVVTFPTVVLTYDLSTVVLSIVIITYDVSTVTFSMVQPRTKPRRRCRTELKVWGESAPAATSQPAKQQPAWTGATTDQTQTTTTTRTTTTTTPNRIKGLGQRRASHHQPASSATGSPHGSNHGPNPDDEDDEDEDDDDVESN